MEIQHKQEGYGAVTIEIMMRDNNKKVAGANLYILHNETRPRVEGKVPFRHFGFIEDVFVDENYRGRGLGTKIVQSAIQLAKERGCYKIVCTSRHENDKVHALYERIGFKNHGLEFRIDLKE